MSSGHELRLHCGVADCSGIYPPNVHMPEINDNDHPTYRDKMRAGPVSEREDVYGRHLPQQLPVPVLSGCWGAKLLQVHSQGDHVNYAPKVREDTEPEREDLHGRPMPGGDPLHI